MTDTQPTKEIVGFNDPADGSQDYTGPLRQIAVTAYRTEQRIRTAVFDVPVDFDNADINAYLARTFDWLGLYEVFDQEERYCIQDTTQDVPWYVVDEPEAGYEWHEIAEALAS